MWLRVEFCVRAFPIMSTGYSGGSAAVQLKQEHMVITSGTANGHGHCEPHHVRSACVLTVAIITHVFLQTLTKQTGTDESIGGIACAATCALTP